MAEKKLTVKMFGGFSASYEGQVLVFGRQRNSKFGQLFQILLTRPGQGFSKEDIAESLYGHEEVEDLNASLNNTIFRLRKYLRESPLPAGEYLQLSGGVVRFDGDIQVESDAWSFECMAREFGKEQDQRRKADICRKACDLYQGEFLPQLSSEQWVIDRSRDYQKQRSAMLNYLLQYFKDEGDYENVEKVSAHAAKLTPYEGWEMWQVDSLIALGRFKEAGEIYREISVHVQQEGGFVSKKVQRWFREVGGRIVQPEGSEEDISRCLMEVTPGEGAYACTLLGFFDCFRMLRRIFARGGAERFILCLCTILDPSGRPAKDRKYCERQSEKLLASFRNCLRRGDIYARYSDSQYLLLCVGAGRENAFELGVRLDVDFRKRSGGRGGINCAFLDDGGSLLT